MSPNGVALPRAKMSIEEATRRLLSGVKQRDFFERQLEVYATAHPKGQDGPRLGYSELALLGDCLASVLDALSSTLNAHESLEQERDTLHAAITVFEASWDTGGYMEPLIFWEKCWSSVDHLVPREHQALSWAVQQQERDRQGTGTTSEQPTEQPVQEPPDPQKALEDMSDMIEALRKNEVVYLAWQEARRLILAKHDALAAVLRQDILLRAENELRKAKHCACAACVGEHLRSPWPGVPPVTKMQNAGPEADRLRIARLIVEWAKGAGDRRSSYSPAARALLEEADRLAAEEWFSS